MIGDFVSVLDGVIIAIAYLTSVADKFGRDSYRKVKRRRRD
jgi:hypothetical protein